jgi:hypothetical protein
MRAIDCPCGHRLEGEGLIRLPREDSRDHPEAQRSGEQLRARVAEEAHDSYY